MTISKRDVIIGASACTAFTAGNAFAAKSSVLITSYPIGSGDELMTLLEATPYVEFGTSGPVVYEVGFRACGPCMIFARKGASEMVQAGFRVRSFIFAPVPTRRRTFTASTGEMASVAEIYKNRSTGFFEAWYRSNSIAGFAATRGLPNFETNTAGKQAIANARKQVEGMTALVNQSVPEATWGYPAFFWRTNSGVRGRFGFLQTRDLLQAMSGVRRT